MGDGREHKKPKRDQRRAKGKEPKDQSRKPHQSSLRVAYTCHVFLGLEPESVGCDFKYKPRDAEQNGFNLPFFAADARKYLPGLFSRNKKGSERCPLSCLMFPWPDQPV